MGRLDAESKHYVNSPRIFADAFNYILYDGDPVIKPENLRAVDTTEIAIPYGNGARIPIQRYRDTLKIWNAMQDDGGIYILLGGEIQDKVHYAMPVKNMLYDAIDYASQVDAARRSYRKSNQEAGIVTENGALTIRLTREEFLSGFRREDKLIPIVTAVIYFGADPWDGPLSIHDMLSYKDARILKAIPDYRINLLSAADTPDGDFDAKFSTGLGLSLHAIKYSSTKAVDVLSSTKKRWIDRESGEFIRDALNMDLEFTEPIEEGVVDVCKAVADYTLKEQVRGAINILRQIGMSDQDIVNNVLKQYDVSEQYVRDLMYSAA